MIRNGIVSMAFAVALGAGLTGCTGITDTRMAPAAGRSPLSQLLVIVQTDTIGSAFAAYRGSVPFASKTGDWQGFTDHLVAGLKAEAAMAGIDATVELVSTKGLPAGPLPNARGWPVLTIRAVSYTARKEAVSGRDLGWSGDTAWDFSLSERPATGPYARVWAAGIKNENLNPALCGNYEGCSKALAGKVFAQMRKDGLIR